MRTITASLVAAAVAYLFAVVAFTGVLDLVALAVFLVLFVVVLLGFERFVMWAETLESGDSTTAQH